MDRILNYPDLNQSTMQAQRGRTHLLAVVAIFLASGLTAQTLASRPDSQDLPTFRAEVAASIAQQGNEAVRQIRNEARHSVRLAQPASLAELASVPSEVAAYEARR